MIHYRGQSFEPYFMLSQMVPPCPSLASTALCCRARLWVAAAACATRLPAVHATRNTWRNAMTPASFVGAQASACSRCHRSGCVRPIASISRALEGYLVPVIPSDGTVTLYGIYSCTWYLVSRYTGTVAKAVDL